MLGLGIWAARRKASGTPAIAGLVASMAFIALNIGISSLTWQAPRSDAPYVNPDRVFASPEPLAFWRRDVMWRERGAIAFGTYDPLQRLTGLTGFGNPVPDNMTDPRVVAAKGATPHVRRFLAWSQLPMAHLEEAGSCTRVTFGDARFTGPALARNFSVSASDCGEGD
jgi:inner membrane protein